MYTTPLRDILFRGDVDWIGTAYKCVSRMSVMIHYRRFILRFAVVHFSSFFLNGERKKSGSRFFLQSSLQDLEASVGDLFRGVS